MIQFAILAAAGLGAAVFAIDKIVNPAIKEKASEIVQEPPAPKVQDLVPPIVEPKSVPKVKVKKNDEKDKDDEGELQ